MGAALAFSTSAQGAPAEPLGHAGRWITDSTGRVVIIHGLNVVPGNFPDTPSTVGFGADDAAFIASQGFNGVRLGMFDAGVEPSPGVYHDSYLQDYERTQQVLGQNGVFTLVDMHQDQYATKYNGRGLPDWAGIDDGLPNTFDPFGQGYLKNPALNRAFDNFWANVAGPGGIGLQNHYREGWRRIAARFADNPGLLGYDIFNEPWPGSAYPTCANPAGCPPGGFDQTLLTNFSRQTIAALRQRDSTHLAFYEPNLEFDFGAATGHGPVGDPKAAFGFHNYCLGAAPGLPHPPDNLQLCQNDEQIVFDNAESHSQSTGAGLLMTEFSDLDDATINQRMTRLADQNMMGWMYWSYFASGETGQIILDPGSPPAPENLRDGILDAIVRPYPQAVSGTPQRFSFDPNTEVFELEYSPARADGTGDFPAGSRTEIFVPKRQYPDGYVVGVQGAKVVSAPGSSILTLASCGTGPVTVRVTSSGGPGQGCPGDLSVMKTDSPDPVFAGEPLTYTVTVTNKGPSTATGVVLTDKLDRSLRVSSARPSQGRCRVRTRLDVVCDLGDLPGGESATATIVVRPTRKGMITNTASVTLSQPTDPDMSNNTATVTTEVKP